MNIKEKTLRLSPDKKTVTDEQGNIIYIANEKNGKTIYVSPLQTKGKVCVEFKIVTKKVCIEWNGPKCITWGGVDTEVCIKWE
jgi:hypothetical protein